MLTVGQYLIGALEACGVEHVFGIPGVHNLELYRGLPRSRLKHVTGRHEQGLGFMADGYARVSGRPAVCFTVTGPGLTNIATAMGQAKNDSIPLLVISTQNRRGQAAAGRGFLHELAGQATIAREVATLAQVISDPGELPEALARAFTRFACCRPGPAYLEIPRDVLASDAAGLKLPAGLWRQPAGPAPAVAVAAAATLLQAARRPVVLAGGGAIAAAAELRALAERLDAPVVMTINGRGILPPGHALAVPFSPSLEAVRALVADADATLAVGTEMGQTDYDIYATRPFAMPAGLVRIDVDPEQLLRNAIPAVGLQGDARATLVLLGACALDGPPRGQGAARAAAARTAALAEISPVMRGQIGLLELIRDGLPGAVLVGDSTQPVYAGNLGYAAATPGSWFNSASGYGTLGYALPAATGASLGAAGRPIVALTGDGGLQFCLGELGVPRDVDAWLALVIWNNGGYREIRNSMLEARLEPSGVEVAPPDFRLLAAAYGYAHRAIGSREQLQAAIAEFGARRQVLVLEVDGTRFE